jgi:hypothetical protein
VATRAGLFLTAVLLFTGAPSRAASLSYFLDHSNALADGPSYLQVTISDGLDGAIDFTVQVLQPLQDIADSNFGIQSFYFNLGGDAGGATVTGLPGGWRAVDRDRNASQFGSYDMLVQGRGSSRVETLQFSITGVDGDEPGDYVLAASRARDGDSYFAAHVAGFLAETCGEWSKGKDCDEISSAFFGGSTVVPLPGAAWLIGTAFAVAALRARRRS